MPHKSFDLAMEAIDRCRQRGKRGAFPPDSQVNTSIGAEPERLRYTHPNMETSRMRPRTRPSLLAGLVRRIIGLVRRRG